MVTEESSPGIKRPERECHNCPSVVEFKNTDPLMLSWMCLIIVYTQKTLASRDVHGVHILLQCGSSYEISYVVAAPLATRRAIWPCSEETFWSECPWQQQVLPSKSAFRAWSKPPNCAPPSPVGRCFLGGVSYLSSCVFFFSNLNTAVI
jgi:hypothetical protein